jgi:hypothetical protein
VPRFPRPRLPRPRVRRRARRDAGTEQPVAETTPSWDWPTESRPQYPLFPRPARAQPAPPEPRTEPEPTQSPPGRVGRVPAAVGSGAAAFWRSLSINTRRRIALAAAVIAGLVLILLFAVPALPCEAPGGDVCPPSDDAAHVAPGDSLAYLHVNVDPDTGQYQAARTLAANLPLFAQQVAGRLASQLPGPHGKRLDFDRDVRPWFGGEAALTLIPAGGHAAEEVQLLEVSDSAGADGFARSILAGKPQTSRYKGVQIDVDRRGVATAQVGGFLAIGKKSGIRDVIDANSGAKGTGSLADDAAAMKARDTLPDDRLADVYLSKDGIARLVSSPGAPLANLATVIDPGASRGMAAALVASDSGLDLDVRSVLDPAREKAHPGFFAAFPTFGPTLGSSMPQSSLAYLGIGDAGQTVHSLLAQSGTREPGLAAVVGDFANQIDKLGGNVNLSSQLPSLGKEAALALEPSNSKTPFGLFLGNDVDANAAGKALADLEKPLAKALARGEKFKAHKVGDVKSHSLKVSGTIELTYAIVRSALVLATDPKGVDQIAGGQGGLADTSAYHDATDGLPSTLSMIGFLNLQGITSLAEQAGLAQNPAYATFAPEIRKLDAVGFGVVSSPGQLATDVRLAVGEGPPAPANTSLNATEPKQ